MKLIMERVKMYNTEDLPVLLTADWNAAANSVVFDSIRDSYNLPDFDSLKIPFSLRSDNQYIVKSADFSG